MKTIRKSMLLMMGTFASVFAFSQINIGLQSTTQAAINSTINAAAITKSTAATTQVTKSTAGAAATKTADVAAKTTTAVKADQSQVAQTNGEVKKSTDINTTIGVSSTQNNTNTGNSGGQVSATSNGLVDAGVKLNGSKIIDKADNATSTITAIAEKKISSTAEAAKKAEAKTSGEVKSDVKAAGETAKTTNANTSGEVKAESSVKLTKQ